MKPGPAGARSSGGTTHEQRSRATTASTTLRVGEDLASPARTTFASWSFGEVKKPETINYRTYRPKRDGLFCERIFGPRRTGSARAQVPRHEVQGDDLRPLRREGARTAACAASGWATSSSAAPIVHIWFFKAMPSRLSSLLDDEDHQPGEGHLLPGLRGRRSEGDTEARRPRRCSPRKTIVGDRDDTASAASKPTWAPRPIRKLAQARPRDRSAKTSAPICAETNSKQKQKDLIKRLKIVEQRPRLGQQAASGWCWT